MVALDMSKSLMNEQARALWLELEDYHWYGSRKRAGYLRRCRDLMARVLLYDQEMDSYALQYLDVISMRIGQELQR